MSDTAPRYTLWQAMNAAISLSLRAIEEVRALSRQPGPPGEPGKDGSPGKLPIVRQWTSGVWYEGDVAYHDGATFQALRDTASAPPHADWQPIATKGVDGRSIEWHGKWSDERSYAIGDAVSWDGALWIAERASPSEPGIEDSGWRIALPRGQRGSEGKPGRQGLPGKDGASVIAIRATGNGPELAAVRDDGETIPFDIEPVLRWYHEQVTR